MNKIDYFISHSRETKYKIAIPLMQTLTELGYEIWLDRKEICVGQHIYSQIEEAIELSNYFIAIIDKTYLERTWTIAELNFYRKKQNNNILPIFVDVEKSTVYKKIPWLEGIAFEKMCYELFNSDKHMDILCRILNRHYKSLTFDSLENITKVFIDLDFPCKDTLISLLQIKEYYSQDFRLATIALCNINDIIYSIYTEISIQMNKLIYSTHQLNDLIKKYCFNPKTIIDYNIYITTYNSVLISANELALLHK